MRTHELSVDSGAGLVVKRFGQSDRGEPAREWRALPLLAEHAPGLAPEPLRADLDAVPPVVEMSLLPGEPLGGAPLTQEQESALVRALGQLWQSVPVERVIAVAGEHGNEAQLVQAVSGARRSRPRPGRRSAGASCLCRRRGLADLGRGRGSPARQHADPAGRQHRLPGWRRSRQGDANLANFLWDGERVRIVDFEDSGISDRAFELAVLVEHISAWIGAGLRGDQFTQAFDLTPAERARLASCRRLAALHWLLLLRPARASEPESTGHAATAGRAAACPALSSACALASTVPARDQPALPGCTAGHRRSLAIPCRR